MKTKYAKDTLQAFRKMISRKNTPEKFWVDKETEYGGTFKKFCKEKDIEVYPTMSETKAAKAAISTKKPAAYIIKDLENEKTQRKFHEKELRKCSD